MKPFTKETLYYLHNGELKDAYVYFGAHLLKDESGEIQETRFRVYAPNANRIDLVGDFNDYRLGAHPMQEIFDGVFEICVPENLRGCAYKYAIEASSGERLYKSDPYAFYSALRPKTPSIVANLDNYRWNDKTYMETTRNVPPYDKQVSVYEVHLGSWMRKPDGSVHDYRELAERLLPYVLEHGFTHIELMPVVEHPFDKSWGYQGTGYFSVTSRYGSVDDFKHFVDACHRAGIRVLLDWVPGHVCKDEHGLYRFDGDFLYEYSDEDIRENAVWGTANLDLGKGETQSFLISNALFYLKEYHIDGFRLDAVSNIIYYLGDSSRGVNERGLEFLRKLSQAVFAYHPQALLVAEDSSAFPKVTHPLESGGLGFNYKWNMGWMNDTLEFFQTPHFVRKDHHGKLTFSLMYAFSENFMLPFSHDEVVHGKKSLLAKMPGDYAQKFRDARTLLGYMFTHPGKTLLFMGNEFAQFEEWKDYRELDWSLLQYPLHDSFKRYVRDWNMTVRSEAALHETDHDPRGFEWIDADNTTEGIVSFMRFDKRREETIVVILNVIDRHHENLPVGVMRPGKYREIINSDQDIYSGGHFVNETPLFTKEEEANGRNHSLRIRMAGLSIALLKWEG